MLSLEDTLDVRSVQMTDMRPFEEQIAGHGIVDGKILLKHPDGRVLKPVQPPPKGGEKKNTSDVNVSSARIEITGKRIAHEPLFIIFFSERARILPGVGRF